MRTSPVPVTLGSPKYRTTAVDGCHVVHAWFPPATVIEPHVHERACFAVMLDGSFDLRFPRAEYACIPGSVGIEPAGERHSNFVNAAGADVLVLQPDQSRRDLWEPFEGLLGAIGYLRHAGIAGLAARVAREIASPDPWSPMAIEALMLEMVVVAARVHSLRPHGTRPPDWLLRAQELLHDQPTSTHRVSQIASSVGVHPAHLARSFRRHFHMSLGTYARRLRVEWAARRLTESDDPIAAIAAAAGYADQSHLTRALKVHAGLTPDQLRRRQRTRHL